MERLRDWSWFVFWTVMGLILVTAVLHFLITSYSSLHEPWFIALGIVVYSLVVAVLASMKEAAEEKAEELER